MNSKVDFSKIKEELDNRKKNLVDNATAETLPKDNFLFELSNSLKNGSISRATERIKLIEDKAAEKNKEEPIFNVASNPLLPKQKSIQQEQVKRPVYDEGIDREEQMFNNINRKNRNSSMSEAIGEFAGNSKQYSKQSTGINEEMLEKTVNNLVIKYLTENLETILSEVIKDTMLEIFAKDRIKTALNEDKETVKKIVYDVIKELQQKNKK